MNSAIMKLPHCLLAVAKEQLNTLLAGVRIGAKKCVEKGTKKSAGAKEAACAQASST